jgi:hypothetical protein
VALVEDRADILVPIVRAVGLGARHPREVRRTPAPQAGGDLVDPRTLPRRPPQDAPTGRHRARMARQTSAHARRPAANSCPRHGPRSQAFAHQGRPNACYRARQRSRGRSRSDPPRAYADLACGDGRQASRSAALQKSRHVRRNGCFCGGAWSLAPLRLARAAPGIGEYEVRRRRM